MCRRDIRAGVTIEDDDEDVVGIGQGVHYQCFAMRRYLPRVYGKGRAGNSLWRRTASGAKAKPALILFLCTISLISIAYYFDGGGRIWFDILPKSMPTKRDIPTAARYSNELSVLFANSNAHEVESSYDTSIDAEPKRQNTEPERPSYIEDANRISEKKHARSKPMPPAHRPMRQSMYERIWVGYHQPIWARKITKFQSFRPPKGNSVCLVHVGKTAGSSIGCALGFNLHCREDEHLHGRLPLSTINAFHKDVYDCAEDIDYYLFVVRDPLARMRSAFIYGRPVNGVFMNEMKLAEQLNKIYLDCGFHTAHELAVGLSKNSDASDDCQQYARHMIRGTDYIEAHMYYNYQYYMKAIPPKSKVVVIRTEHMEEDWNDIEVHLGGKARQNITFPHENSKPKEEGDLVLGDEERMILCDELCIEIQYYKRILRKAININEEQYEISMRELLESCPNEAKMKECDRDPPEIREKLVENRGYPNH